jgi:hypothetical protein
MNGTAGLALGAAPGSSSDPYPPAGFSATNRYRFRLKK